MYFGLPTFGIPDYGVPSFGIPGTYSISYDNINTYVINFIFTIPGDEEAITPNLYKYVSDKYGLVYKNIQNSYNDINSAVTYIAKIDNVEAKLDLLKPFRQNSNSFKQNKFIAQLYTATIRLNTHVQDRSNNGDLNVWLFENEIKVVPEWALLCEETGIIIDPSNIQS